MRVMGVGLAAGLALGVWQSGCAGGSCPECTAAVELCDGLDNDGDGAVDEDAADALEWFTDADGDGYGGSSLGASCTAPSGAVTAAGDCDDSSGFTHPGAPEDCDGVDNDCSGSASDGAAEGWVTDADRWERELYLWEEQGFFWMSPLRQAASTGHLWGALHHRSYQTSTDELGLEYTVYSDVTVSLVELTPDGPVLRSTVLSETWADVEDLAVDEDGTVWVVWTDADERGHLTRWDPATDYASSIWLNAYGPHRLVMTDAGLRVFATVGTLVLVFDEDGGSVWDNGDASVGMQAWDVARVGDEVWVAGSEHSGGEEDAVLWRWSPAGVEELFRYPTSGEDRFNSLAAGEDGRVWLSWTLEATSQDLWSLLTVEADNPAALDIADAVDYGTVRITPGQVAAHPFAGGVGGAWINSFTYGTVLRVGLPDAMAQSLSLPYETLDGLGVDGEGDVWVAAGWLSIYDSEVSVYRLRCAD